MSNQMILNPIKKPCKLMHGLQLIFREINNPNTGVRKLNSLVELSGYYLFQICYF